MTREEILQMEAGEEIDKLIAEKVMGWHSGVTEGGSKVWLDKNNRYMQGMKQNDYFEDEEDFHILNWHPSESILWAWDVVEKFYSMKLGKYSNGEEWRAYLVIERSGANVDASASADTAPLAICRAALLIALEREWR